MEEKVTDPWESLMNAGTGMETFLLLLGPLLMGIGLIAIFSVFYFFYKKRRQKGFDDLMKSMPDPENDSEEHKP